MSEFNLKNIYIFLKKLKTEKRARKAEKKIQSSAPGYYQNPQGMESDTRCLYQVRV